MEQWQTILSVTAAIFGIVAIGAGCRKGRWLTEEADESLLKLMIRLLLPCLILSTVMGSKQLQQASDLVLPPILGFASLILGFAAALAFAAILGSQAGLTDATRVRTFALCVGLHNYGYIPIPLVKSLFSDDTLAVLFIHNVGIEIGLWTVGIVVLTGSLGRDWWKKVLNPPLLAISLGLLINLGGFVDYVPSLLMAMVTLLGEASIPLSLLLVGATMADEFGGGAGKITEGWGVISSASLLRLGLIPAIMVAATVTLPLPLDLQRVLIIEAAMPAAAFPVIMAKHYGGHPPTALRVVIGTSALGLVTVTLWIALGLRLLPSG